MKANQFAKSDEAVSPVIGVILMVAITVVLAAVVFVLVTKLSGNQQNAAENASVSMSSPASGKIYITLVSGGANVPYCVSGTVSATPVCSAADVTISVDSQSCTIGLTGTTAILQDQQTSGAGTGRWNAGETIVIGGTSGGTPCGGSNSLTSGSTHLVSVVIHGTLIQDNTKVVVS